MSKEVEFVRQLAGRCVTAAALGLAERACRRTGRRRPAATASRTRGAALVIACTAPAAAVGITARRHRAAWRPPRTATGRALVALYLLSGVLVEELLWRAPLLYLRPRPALVVGAGVSAAAFAAVHVRRDGVRTLWIHLPTAAGFTLATLVEGRVRAAVLAHLLYNLTAVCLVDAADGGACA